MAHIKLLQHGLVDDKLSGDVVGWCPAADFQHYFVIGCYYQHQGNREGKILLFKYDNGAATQIQSVATNAVLDLKWRDRDLYVATAAGTEQWRVESDALTTHTAQLVLVQRWSTESLALYLALHQNHVLTSTEQGALIARSVEDGSVTWQSASAHNYSAWCVQSGGGTVFVSGGDDCALKVWDLRCAAAVASNTKHYAMGVTDIEFLPWEHSIAVGSYDESIKLWDLRSLREPTAHQTLGGGVWRIRRVHNSLLGENTDSTHTDRTSMVLAVGCASNHFKLLHLTTAQTFHELVEHRHTDLQVSPHDTLAYGIDWCRAEPDLYVTCSFYDKIYSVWSASS